jgi:6-pyruvoyltetrahydropterin/6-carboxytetrahydropterin synthase
MIQYNSTKKFGPISVGHRQWRDNGHCRWAHGYGRYVQFTFACDKLDERQWVMDFGGLKDIKAWLESQWDHRMLLASDDPLLEDFQNLDIYGGMSVNVMDVTKGWGPGIEGSCKFIYDNINPVILEKTKNRVWIAKIEVWEHENNSAVLHAERPA